jgi:hypothetical protein
MKTFTEVTIPFRLAVTAVARFHKWFRDVIQSPATVTNMDESDLLILDPERDRFRAFPGTSATGCTSLILRDNSEVFADNIPHQVPDPWNSWSMDWADGTAGPGESKTFIFNYTLTTQYLPRRIPGGIFKFPGLSYQVSAE